MKPVFKFLQLLLSNKNWRIWRKTKRDNKIIQETKKINEQQQLEKFFPIIGDKSIWLYEIPKKIAGNALNSRL